MDVAAFIEELGAWHSVQDSEEPGAPVRSWFCASATPLELDINPIEMSVMQKNVTIKLFFIVRNYDI